jgi:hypothetical protein
MVSILEGELAAEVAERLGDMFYACTITRTLPGGIEPPHAPHNPGPTTPCVYDAKGIVDTYRADLIDGTLIKSNDRKVLILVPSIAKAASQPMACTAATITPAPGDKCTIRGLTGTIITVSADPALATFELQVRF